MIPKLTDDAISMLPLESGRAELLEEIMTTVAPDRQNAEPTRPRPRAAPAGWRPLAAAAVVAGLAGGTAVVAAAPRRSQDDSDQRGRRARPARGPGRGARRAGLEGRLARTATGSRFRKGDARPRDHVVRRRATTTPTSRTASTSSTRPPPGDAGRGARAGPGSCGPTRADDHTAIREVEDGHWMEFRAAGHGPRRPTSRCSVSSRLASDAEFEASLPEDYVAEDERAVAAEQILGEIAAVSGAGFPRRRAPSVHRGRRQGPLPVRRRGRRQLRLRLARGVRERQDPRPGRTRDGGRAGPGDVARVADPEADERRRRLPRGGLGATPTRRPPVKVPDWYREGLGCLE